MKTIAIDIDNVLAMHANAVMGFYNETYGTKLTMADYDEQWSWMGSEELIENFRPKLQKSGIHVDMKVIEGAYDTLKVLKKRYNLEIITARWNILSGLTLEWVERHYPGIFSGVHFAQVWKSDDKKISKAEICRQINASYLIDDNISHCVIAATAGIKCILFGDYSWNRSSELPGDVVQCTDWNDVLEYFNEKAGE